MARTIFRSSQEYPGSTVFRPWGGHGVPAEDFPLNSVLDNDVQLPAMAGMELRAELITEPAGVAVAMDSYGRLTANDPPAGTHEGTYRLWVDGVEQTPLGNYSIYGGAVTVSGSMAATEAGADAFAATGTVAAPGATVSGSMAATEVGADTFAATGTVAAPGATVSGSMAATEAGADAFAATGTVAAPGATVSGSMAATEVGADAFAATGTVATAPATITGVMSAAEVGADVLSAAGTVADQPQTITGFAVLVEQGADRFAAGNWTGLLPAAQARQLAARRLGVNQ